MKKIQITYEGKVLYFTLTLHITYENQCSCLIISHLFSFKKGEKEKSPSPQKQENPVRSENDDNHVNNTGPTNVGEETKQLIQEEENDENSHPTQMPVILNNRTGNESMRTLENHTTSTSTSDNNSKQTVFICKAFPNSKYK